MNRRAFVSSLGAAAASAPLRTRGGSGGAGWNVLLIMNDQHRADCLGVMGNPVIRTPNIDRLAGEGALFERYYVQCPQCVPSRSALHTGRYPHVNRTPSNRYRLPSTERTLADILGKAGYATASVGELPFAPTKSLGGFQSVVASDPEYNAFLAAHGWGGKKLTAARAALLRQHRDQSQRQFQASPVPWPEALDETPFFAARAIDFLKRNTARPFFLHVNFRRPHHPFDPPAPFDRAYEGVPFPASHRRDGEMRNKPPAQRKALANSVGFDLRTMTAADLDRVKSYYYGMISLNDKYIGKILDNLEGLGLAERTLVVFASDHGEMLGDHGLLFKGGYFYEGVVHVPMILRVPGVIPAGRRVPELVEEIDVLPTILEILGMPIPAGIQGNSLVGLARGNGGGRTEVHAEFPNAKMLQNAHWKLVHYLNAPYGELYNLLEDPYELQNLYEDAGSAKARHEMESSLIDWLVNSRDPLLAPVEA